MKEVELPDGTVIDFPDSMTSEQISAAIKSLSENDQAFAARLQPVEKVEALSAGAGPQRQQNRFDEGTASALTMQGLSGFNRGVANTVGAPVDLVNFGLKQVGLGSERPVLGSDFIKDQFRNLDIGFDVEPRGTAERVVDRVGQELGASMLPAAGTIKFANRLTPARAGFDAAKAGPLALARENAGRFATGEAVAATGSGLGAATAKEVAPDSAIAEIGGSLLGGLTGFGVTEGVRRVAQGGRGAALREGIDDAANLGLMDGGPSPTLGTLSGRNSVNLLESTLSRLPGGRQIARSAARTEKHLAQRVAKLTQGSEGSAAQAGRAIEKGLFGDDGFVSLFKRRTDTLFSQIDKHIPVGSTARVDNTSAMLNDLAGGITGAEATSKVITSPFIKQIAASFAADVTDDGTIPYAALKQLRSAIGRKVASKDLVSDAPRADLKRIYGALTEDMKVAAQQAGPEAERALSRANKFYAAGLSRIDDQLQKLSNKVSPEEVFKAAVSGSREGGTRLFAIKRSLQPDEWKTVVDTVVKRLGRATNSNQDDLGEVFSAETFLTNWNALAPRAKGALFGNAKEYRKNMDTIARMASRLREAGRAGANPSGTAGALTDAVFTGGVAFNLASGNVPVGAGLAFTGLSSISGNKLLTNPAFVKWTAQLVQSPAKRVPGQLARLATVARENPELTEDLARFIRGIVSEPVRQPSGEEQNDP